ncbi:hypothetical protein C8R46DRAFT_1357642 [Mycena filopes]|nr:hypothetical protein C8R46DRAFT_1357642 [Mycena filopes]
MEQPPQHVFSPQMTGDMPEEILLHIFRLALPPSWILDPGTYAPPFPHPVWSSDVPTKLAFLKVCKTWYRIALELLYENVELRHIGQMVAFTGTLEDRPELGALVRSVKLCYYIPHHAYAALHTAEAKTLFALCPAVTHLTFYPLVGLGLLQPALPTLSPNCAITNLDLGDAAPYGDVLPTLTLLAATLVSLSITLPRAYAPTHPHLTFTRLRNLRLSAAAQSTFPAAHYALPALAHLSFCHNYALGSLPPTLKLAADVLAASPRTLTHLHLAAVVYDLRMAHTTLADVLRLVPALTHLCATQWQLEGLVNAHAGVCALDVLCYDDAPFHRDDKAALAEFRRTFPALTTYRPVDEWTRHPYFVPDSNAMISPSHFTAVQPESAPVVAVVGQVGPSDFNFPTFSWLAAFMAEELDEADEPGDEDFVFQEGDDDGGSATDSSGSESESDGLESGGEGEEEERKGWEVGREEVLEIYRRGLELRAARDVAKA